jgi:excisionase family DNA binding protein
MHNVVLSPIDPEKLISRISDMVTSKILNALKSDQLEKQNTNDFLDIQEAGELLNLAKSTIYSKVSKGELPVMKRGKKLYFSKAELISFIEQGRKSTNEEREAEAAKFLAGTKEELIK